MAEFIKTEDIQSVLGIEDFTQRKDYGRERGTDPVLTDSQSKAFTQLTGKLQKGRDKNEDTGETIEFDIKSKKRCLLFEAKVQKRSYSSAIKHTSSRHLVLLNDVLLVCSIASFGGNGYLSSITHSEKYSIRQIFPIDQIYICDLNSIDPHEGAAGFLVGTKARPYEFIAESETDKKIWLEELELAIFAMKKEQEGVKLLGWQHATIRGTMYSFAMLGQLEHLNRSISNSWETQQSLDVTDESGLTPLHWASLGGHLSCVQALLNSGSMIDTLDSGLNSALLIAAAHGHEPVVRYLIDRGGDTNLRNLKDFDCLLMAVLYGNRGRGGPDIESLVETLVEEGVDLNNMDSTGATPLHHCAMKSLPGPIGILVNAGADINAQHERSGLTPLQLACTASCPDPETVRSLLEKGSFPNMKDSLKRTAFDMVLISHDEKKRKGTMDQGMLTADFATHALPVLMELAKRGGRHSKENAIGLRDSFKVALQNAVQHWETTVQPEDCEKFMEFQNDQTINVGFSQAAKIADSSPASKRRGSRMLQANAGSKYMDDSASQSCIPCSDKFNVMNRRHHCRSCGVLCCDLCSSKRMTLCHSLLMHAKHPKSAGSDESISRVCDSCFNKILVEFRLWSQRETRQQKEEKKRQEVEAAAIAAKEAAGNKNILGSLFNHSAHQDGAAPPSSAQSAHATANETMRVLHERGEKLQEMGEKSEALRDGAEDFLKSTKELVKRKQEENKKYGIL